MGVRGRLEGAPSDDLCSSWELLVSGLFSNGQPALETVPLGQGLPRGSDVLCTSPVSAARSGKLKVIWS